jgi:hypothetical protein
MPKSGIFLASPVFSRRISGRHPFVWLFDVLSLPKTPAICMGKQSATVTTLMPKNPLEEIQC